MQHPNTLMQEDQARVGLYSLLARLLARPASEQDLSDVAALVIGAESGEPGGTVVVALSMLRLAASKARAADVDNEYHKLFIGLGRGELVPYGSWYQTGYLMERPLSELRQDLARLGLERQPGHTDPEDHVAFLCEVMAFLIANPEFDEEQQKRFFQAHIAPWIAAFFRDLEQAQSAFFYKAVGHLGSVLMVVEATYLGIDLPAVAAEYRANSDQNGVTSSMNGST